MHDANTSKGRAPDARTTGNMPRPADDLADIEPELRRDWETYGQDKPFHPNPVEKQSRDARTQGGYSTCGPNRH